MPLGVGARRGRDLGMERVYSFWRSDLVRRHWGSGGRWGPGGGGIWEGREFTVFGEGIWGEGTGEGVGEWGTLKRELRGGGRVWKLCKKSKGERPWGGALALWGGGNRDRPP